MTAYPPPKPPAPAIAIVALIVGIAAFLTGFVPYVGLALAIAGFVLARLALRGTVGRGISVTGQILSIIAACAGVLSLLFVFLIGPAIGSWIAHGGYDNNASENSRYDESYDPSGDYLVDTPCYSFTGPANWINHQSPYVIPDCLTSLEDYGPLDDTGRYVFDSFDTDDYGSVTVSPEYDGPTSVPNDLQLDGVDASLSTVPGDTDNPMTQHTIQVVVPEQRSNYWGQFSALTITIEAPDGDAEQILSELVDTWTWN